MTQRNEPRRLNVTSALDRGALRGASAMHRAAENPTIDSVALIVTPDQARRVAPRSAVVIAGGAETSGWLVSSVLRFAWERRASLVIAGWQQPDSVVALARRLDITLVSVSDDPTSIALKLAADIGAANSAVEAQLMGAIRRVGSATSVELILRTIAAELGDTRLELTYRAGVVLTAGGAERDPKVSVLSARIAGSPDDPVELRAYPATASVSASFAQSLFELVVPHLRAAWAEQVSADRLAGIASVSAARESAGQSVGGAQLLDQLGWKSGQYHAAVLLRLPPGGSSRTLGQVVRLVWQRAMGRVPLAETFDGWIAVLEATDEDDLAAAVDLLRSHAAPGLGELGVGIGVSSFTADSARLDDLLTEARSAARVAQSSDAVDVGVFDDLGLTAIGYLFDADDVRAIAHLVVPDFCAAVDREVLAESVSAFLAARSVTSAADSLGIHRNTLTMRLDRARALGLPIGEPDATLPIMALVRAFLSRSTATTVTAQQPSSAE